jgi:hypothetical protein
MNSSDVEARTVLTSYHYPATAIDHPTAASCITGMHRSGTSMVARLLHECGVFLGPLDELSQPAPDNLEGHFENLRFVMLNEEIMTQFGGTWNDPPRLPTGWEFGPEASSFLQRADDLIDVFRRQNWGWKDPRNSLTLPFWQRVIPDLRVIVCVRNPLEVARSLFLRGDTIGPSHFELWLTYYRQLLSTARPTQRLVTHYESYFQDPRAELIRVLDWLDLKASDDAIEHACTHVSAGLRHHRVTAAELIDTDVPFEVLSLYLDLCAEAGPIYEQARKVEVSGKLQDNSARANEVGLLFNELQQLRSSVASREQILSEILNSKSFRLVSFFWRLRRKA